MLKWLRTLDKTGSTVGWVIAIIESKITWVLVVSAFIGSLTSLWTTVFEFFNNRHTQIAIGVFIASLWTYIGIRVLRSSQEVVRVTTAPDYRYCLNPEGFQLFIDPKGTDLALNVGFLFRNVGNWPVRFRVEKFQLLIEDRTCPEPEKLIELIIPRIGVRLIRSGAFKKDVLNKDRNTGTLDVAVIYGPPEGDPVRRYRFKAKLQFAFPKDVEGNVVAAAIGEEVSTEEDTPI